MSWYLDRCIIPEIGKKGKKADPILTVSGGYGMVKAMTLPILLLTIYHRLLERFGPRHWWPGETPFEVIVGAILTQATAWRNVEKAIANLKAAGALTPVGMAALSQARLAELIRPAGYHQVKARKLRAFLEYLDHDYAGNLERLLTRPMAQLRPELLACFGIGPETADSILLYAAGQPSFVVDAYTRRIFARLRVVSATIGYEPLRAMFMAHLPTDVHLFNEYHALLVALGQQHCLKHRPDCPTCPILPLCPTGHPYVLEIRA